MARVFNKYKTDCPETGDESHARAMAFLVGNAYYQHDQLVSFLSLYLDYLERTRRFLQQRYDALWTDKSEPPPLEPIAILPQRYSNLLPENLMSYSHVLNSAMKALKDVLESTTQGKNLWRSIVEQLKNDAENFDKTLRERKETDRSSTFAFNNEWFNAICERASEMLKVARFFYDYPYAIRASTNGLIVHAMVKRPSTGPQAYQNLNDVAHPNLNIESDSQLQAYNEAVLVMKQDAERGQNQFLPGDVLLVESLARGFKGKNEFVAPDDEMIIFSQRYIQS